MTRLDWLNSRTCRAYTNSRCSRIGTKTKGTPSPMSINGISSWPTGVRCQSFSIYSTSARNKVSSIIGIVTAFTFFSSTNFAEFNQYMIFQSQNGNYDIALALVIVYTTIVGLTVFTDSSTNLRDVF